jgi:hypothetical protein
MKTVFRAALSPIYNKGISLSMAAVFFVHSLHPQNLAPQLSVSPYVISIQQPDGSTLRIIGKVEGNVPYTETEDGYTVLKNRRNVYEYAKKGRHGKLVPGGIKAKDAAQRSASEKNMLLKLSKHLRHDLPYLKTIKNKYSTTS